jgi:hypothetical protein
MRDQLIFDTQPSWDSPRPCNRFATSFGPQLLVKPSSASDTGWINRRTANNSCRRLPAVPCCCPCELVVAATATDEDQRHQSDAQCERNDDPENQSDPAGRADVPVADAGQRGGYYETDNQNDGDGDRHRDRIAAEQSVMHGGQAGWRRMFALTMLWALAPDMTAMVPKAGDRP